MSSEAPRRRPFLILTILIPALILAIAIVIIQSGNGDEEEDEPTPTPTETVEPTETSPPAAATPDGTPVATPDGTPVATPIAATPEATPLATPEPDVRVDPGVVASRTGTFPGPGPEGSIGILWNSSVNIATNTPTIVGNRVLVASDTDVTAFDATTGEQLWGTPVGNAPTAPQVLEDHVFTVDSTGTVTALNLSDGDVVWETAPEEPLTSTSRPPVPVALDDALYVAFGETLLALDVESGEERWEKSLPRPAADRPLAAGEGLVTVMTPSANGSGNSVHAFEPDGGQEVWRYQSAASLSPIAISGSYGLVTTEESDVVALRMADGTQAWSHAPSPVGECSTAAPIVEEGEAFLACTTGIYRYSVSGGFDTRISDYLTFASTSPMVAAVSENVLYVTDEESISAVNATSGSRMWSYDLNIPREAEFVDNASVQAGRVYIPVERGDNTNHLYVLGGTSGEFGGELPEQVTLPLEMGLDVEVVEETPLLAAPSEAGAPLGTLMDGQELIVTGGAEPVDGVVWWPVMDPDTGQQGFVNAETIASFYDQ